MTDAILLVATAIAMSVRLLAARVALFHDGRRASRSCRGRGDDGAGNGGSRRRQRRS